MHVFLPNWEMQRASESRCIRQAMSFCRLTVEGELKQTNKAVRKTIIRLITKCVSGLFLLGLFLYAWIDC